MNHEKHDPLTAAGTFDDLAISLSLPAVPGEYRAEIIACRQLRRFGRELLFFEFRLSEQGPFLGAVLPAYVNFEVGTPGGPHIPARSKLRSWLRTIQSFDPSISTGRVPLSIFSRYEFEVKVVLVLHDFRRKPIAPRDQTPIVQEILRVVGKSQNAKKREENKNLFCSSLLSPPLQGGTP